MNGWFRLDGRAGERLPARWMQATARPTANSTLGKSDETSWAASDLVRCGWFGTHESIPEGVEHCGRLAGWLRRRLVIKRGGPCLEFCRSRRGTGTGTDRGAKLRQSGDGSARKSLFAVPAQ